VGCYVQHNTWITRGRPWGGFLDVRTNAIELYRRDYAKEQRWGRSSRGGFGIFLSSSTDPFVPQEQRYRITRDLLEAMCESPPDLLIIQTHTHLVTEYIDLYHMLANKCELRIHLSIESDLDRLPGLPPPASSVEQRLMAAAELKHAGLFVVITVSPLLPIQSPESFFERIAETADAVVIDHFIEGDGTATGARTIRTKLPEAMSAIDPSSIHLEYRERMVQIAERVLTGRVGVSVDGFAGRYLPRR
jgi:DNA repair photolyase